jgi:hypothetical protein
MRALVILLTAMVCGCSTQTGPTRSGATPATPIVDVLTVDDQVREAVFRYQFTHNASGMKERAPVYFLSLGEVGADQNPSAALMARFANHQPRVEPMSRASITLERGVRHRDTDERGLAFRVTSMKWVSADVVEVEGGYYEGSLSSSGNTYRVERTGGAWVVTGDTMHWIS